MKCPLQYWVNYKGPEDATVLAADCLQEECAWWMPELGHCAVGQLAHHLWLMEGSIAEMREKMPDMGQFTK